MRKLTKLKIIQGNRTSIVECNSYQYAMTYPYEKYTELKLFNEKGIEFCVFKGVLTFEELPDVSVFTEYAGKQIFEKFNELSKLGFDIGLGRLKLEKEKAEFERNKSILSDRLEVIAHNIIDVARSIKK